MKKASAKTEISSSNRYTQKKKVKSIFNSNPKKVQEKKETFLALFQQYEADIYRMAFIYVKNKEDALDIVQETAYRSYTRFHTLKDTSLFKTWIIRISINCAIDFLRKKRQTVQLNMDFLEVSHVGNEDISLSMTIQYLLDTLDEHEKTIVLLKYYQGYTFAEIAEILHTPTSTVKSVLYRALHNLRQKTGRAELYGQ